MADLWKLAKALSISTEMCACDSWSWTLTHGLTEVIRGIVSKQPVSWCYRPEAHFHHRLQVVLLGDQSFVV